MFSTLYWAMPKLPAIAGIEWQADWPDDFSSLPRGSIREASNETGVITTEGEGSALISFYVDIWQRTPEEREANKILLSETLIPLMLNRGSSMDTVEIWRDGTKAYRSTILFRGEWDHDLQAMRRPRY